MMGRNERYYPTPTSEPDGVKCITVPVPNERHHLAAFYGALLDLAQWINWQRNAEHDAQAAAAIWRKIWLELIENDCATPPPPPTVDTGCCAIDWSDDMQLRQQDCKLQAQCSDGSWTTIYDPSACVPQLGAQPGAPGGQPEQGTCVTYHAQLDGSGQWLLPVSANAGDTITVSNTQGGWSDGAGGWNCPNGQPYVLAQCVGLGGPVSGDPDPTVDHMRLIAKIGAAYLDAYNRAITVPAGVVSNQVTFQANDSVLTNNAGSISFDVEYCANGNQTASCAQPVNFKINQFGSFNVAYMPVIWNAAPLGKYVVGAGWENQQDPAAMSFSRCIFRLNFPTPIVLQGHDAGLFNVEGHVDMCGADDADWQLFAYSAGDVLLDGEDSQPHAAPWTPNRRISWNLTFSVITTPVAYIIIKSQATASIPCTPTLRDLNFICAP